MKLIALFAAILLSGTIGAQDSLENIISSQVCDCLTEKQVRSQEDFLGCFAEVLEDNKQAVAEACFRLYQDTSYESGYKWGKLLYQKIAVSMVASCTPYYQIMDSVRNVPLLNANTDSLRLELQKMYQQNSGSSDKRFYADRGLLHFQLNELPEALADFEQAVTLDSNYVQTLFFRAWTHERMKHWDETRAQYTALTNKTQVNDFLIFA
ncbi:MAG TPA: tetratricopeptide repeat protein, partial [Chitinophagaceae bacterium]|nr:tetratricopeptide repeat protein [Chitinophagaceae bacterium]